MFDDTIIIISEAVSAHGTLGKSSKNISGKGPYVFLSGTRSCTNDRDAVDIIKPNTKQKKAETKTKQSVQWANSLTRCACRTNTLTPKSF